MDPRLRQRQEVIPVRQTIKKDVSNGDLLDSFTRSLTGRSAVKTVENYAGSIRDAILYFTQDGHEIPLREWTKEEVWGYVHFVEANYCASFATAPYQSTRAMCRQRVWIGAKLKEDAARENCASCPHFKRPMVEHRLNALNKFFKYLARVGAVPHNFMADVVSEHYEESPGEPDHREKRRNPSIEEQRALVNGTAHPQRRAFYATSAKWWFRPNEMFMLDRYASFGLEPPAGSPRTRGFEAGFTAHSNLANFAQAGDVVYLPETKGATDKRKGNRWSVIDSELRPILEQHFAWWERTVRRDTNGQPITTQMWLTETGLPLSQKKMYDSLFRDDTLRLGLVKPDEVSDPKRAWTAHCQRHFGEKLLEMHNVPDNWCNHFRGDKFRDARGHYFKPTPEQVRTKYHELVPMIGFQPLPEAARLRRGITSERDTHEEVLKTEIARMEALTVAQIDAKCAIITTAGEEFVVPQRVVPSFLYALRAAFADSPVEIKPAIDADPRRGCCLNRRAYLTLIERARSWIP